MSDRRKVIAAGDPYQWQVERTAEAVVAQLDRPDLDWLTCYQSRVGPLEWISVQDMAAATRVCLRLVQDAAQE